MLTAADEKAFQQFTQMILNSFFKKDVLRRPSHNKLVFHNTCWIIWSRIYTLLLSELLNVVTVYLMTEVH